METGKTGKYFKYAIGEIVLVVIGILIALQINNWNEQRKNSISEVAYLMNLREDVKADMNFIKRNITNRYEGKVKSLQTGKAYYQGIYTIKDTLDFLNELGYGSVFGNIVWNFKKTTYEQLISTGDFTKISNDSLLKTISAYYNTLNAIIESSLDNETGYIKYTNAKAPFKRDEPDFISKFDQKFFIQSLKSDRFYELLNLELTLAYTMKRNADLVLERAETLIKLIDLELEE